MIGACWAQEPHQRPSFAKLSKALKEGVALHEGQSRMTPRGSLSALL